MYERGKIILNEQSRKDDLKKGSKKENGKTKRFTIRLTEEEHQEFIAKAKKQNMSISQFLIYLVKKEK